MEFFCTIDSPIGPLTLAEDHHALTRIQFGTIRLPEGTSSKTTLLQETERQLREYFAGIRRAFDLPLAPKGTPFRKKVWTALQTIPYGQSTTYQEIAIAAGCPKGFRAVGMANHCNPIAIVIPCHRVIGKNGSLTGYAGGLDIKQFLLELEQGGTAHV